MLMFMLSLRLYNFRIDEWNLFKSILRRSFEKIGQHRWGNKQKCVRDTCEMSWKKHRETKHRGENSQHNFISSKPTFIIFMFTFNLLPQLARCTAAKSLLTFHRVPFITLIDILRVRCELLHSFKGKCVGVVSAPRGKFTCCPRLFSFLSET